MNDQVEVKEYEVAEFNKTEAGLADLADRFSVVPDATTPEGYEAVKVGLKELVTTRTSLEKMRLKLNEDDQARIKFRNNKAKEITAKIVKLETPYKEAKEAVDLVEKREKEEKAKREQERLDKLQAKIDMMRESINIVQDVKTITTAIDTVTAIDPLKGFDEFAEAAGVVKNQTLTRLNEMLETAEEQERQAEEVRKVAEQQAEEKRKLAEEQAMMDAERAKMQEEMDKLKAEKEAIEKAKQEEADRIQREKEAEEAEKKRQIEEQKAHEQRVLDAEMERVRVEEEAIEKIRLAKEQAERFLDDALELFNVRIALNGMITTISSIADDAQPETQEVVGKVVDFIADAVEVIDTSIVTKSQEK